MEPLSIGLIAASVLIAIVTSAFVGLRGWNSWLEFKRLELTRGVAEHSVAPATAGRIELADLRERVRKLEAIAAGIDL